MYAEFLTKDDMEMTITLTTYSGSSSIGSSTGKGTVRINVDEAKPLVNSFTYADTVSECISITGNSKHIIQNASIIRASSISATGRKGASIVKYQLVIGDRAVESTSTTITDTATVPSNTGVTVKAIDSRGLEGSLTVPFDMYYEYDRPRLSQLVPHRRNGVEDAVLLNMVGEFHPLVIGSTTKNNSCLAEYAKRRHLSLLTANIQQLRRSTVEPSVGIRLSGTWMQNLVSISWSDCQMRLLRLPSRVLSVRAFRK